MGMLDEPRHQDTLHDRLEVDTAPAIFPFASRRGVYVNLLGRAEEGGEVLRRAREVVLHEHWGVSAGTGCRWRKDGPR